MTAIAFAASIVLGFAATSTPAVEPNPAPSPVATTAAVAAPMAVTLAAGPAAIGYKASPKARYCFRTERTGSHLRPTVCKTRSQWEAMGADLDAALAGR